MNNLHYRELALQWRPGTRNDVWFSLLTALFVGLTLGLGYLSTRIEIPAQPRDSIRPPERVARFITQNRQTELPRPAARKPEPSPKPVVQTEIVSPAKASRPESAPDPRPRREKKAEPPENGQQRQAREKALDSGLLKQMETLRELADTGDLAGQLARPLTAGSESGPVATAPGMPTAARDSGGVEETGHRVSAAGSTLERRENPDVQEILAANSQAFAEPAEKASLSGGESRSQEEITLVVDRHKGQLQALYNRARRATPSLRGTLVVALTIAPDGSVTTAEIVSSELDDPGLEASILGRLKALRFTPKDVPALTIRYPIEFLP